MDGNRAGNSTGINTGNVTILFIISNTDREVFT